MVKRVFDIVCAGVALLFLAPILVVVAVVLRCTGEGEIFYRQERVGRGGRRFGLYKFATMLRNSPALGTGDITLKNDPRVLPIGKILRKTKLNELPQLLNILSGDMSFIGPRPLTPRNFSYYPERVQHAIQTLRPGLSGVGSIIFRDEESILNGAEGDAESLYRTKIAPYKGALEEWYAAHQSFVLDLLLCALTLWVVVHKSSTLPWKLLPNLPAAPDFLVHVQRNVRAAA